MLIYLRVTLILASGGFFLGGWGGGVIFPCGLLGFFFFCLFVFNCFWQNHCNAGSVGNGMA